MPTITLQDLPAISPLAHELFSLSLDADDAEATLRRIVESEPQLYARLIAVANSAAYAAPGQTVLSVPAALRRLGLARVKQLAIGILYGHPLSARLRPGVAEHLWLHALAMAAAAQEIARIKRFVDPAAAYLAGLVHDLGYLLEEAADQGCLERVMSCAVSENLAPETAEIRLLGADHAALTACLLRYWGAPAVIGDALAGHHDDHVAPDSLAAIVFGAEKLARFAEVTDALYAGIAHPFESLSIDRLGLEFLFDQQLELTADEVSRLASRIIDQVDGFRESARAMAGAH